MNAATLAHLERAYLEAAHQAIGANMMRLELDLPPAVSAKARAYAEQLREKALTAHAEWVAATQVVATPEALRAAADVAERHPAFFVVASIHESTDALAA